MNHPDPHADEHADRFTLLRPLLFTIAYEILGSATEADDVLQDSYLRWATVDLDGVRDTKAYLAQLVTRQALNTLRAEARRREQYVGPWLPEPLLVDRQQTAADAAEDVLLAESVSMAMLVVLETLSPDERAVFVLHDVFGFEHAEIASAIGKSAAAVRQLAHRARSHVQSRRRRFEPVDAAMSAELVTSFFAAAATGGTYRRMIEDALPRLSGNFFSVDLQAGRKAFESVPWVRRAVVRRVWWLRPLFGLPGVRGQTVPRAGVALRARAQPPMG